MLPVLGDFDPSTLELSAEEEEIAEALRRHSSARVTSWPALFLHHEDVPIRRAAFIVYWLCKCVFGNFPYYAVNTLYIPLAVKIFVRCCFPLAPMYSQLNLLHDCEIEGDSCHIITASFNTTVLQNFFWEHSVSYTFVAKDKKAAWGKFSNLPQRFLDRSPDFQDNLPLVYRWVGLKTRDHKLVASLDFEGNVSLRPYGEDYPGFSCISTFSWFSQSASLNYELKAEESWGLAYLSAISPGWLPILSTTSLEFTPYCVQRLRR
jgi:hypothetical protein